MGLLRRERGLLFTLGTLGVIELLSNRLHLDPNPAPIYLAVVYATFSSGLPIGLISAALAVAYMAYALSGPGSLFHYSRENGARFLLVTLSSPGIALMVGLLKRHAERREAEARGRLTAILEATPDVVATADGEGRLLYVNRSGRLLLGLEEAGKPPNMRLTDVLSEGSRPLLAREGIPAALRSGAWSGETCLKSVDGREIPVSQVLLAHKAPDGTVAFFSTIARDIGERMRLEEQVRQSQKMEAVGRLAGGVSHDFNNLLTVVLSHAGFLAKDLPDSDPRRRDAEQILAAARRAAALTRQLLVFSRRDVIRPVPMDLNRTVAELATLLRRTLGETSELVTSLAPGLWPVKADPGQIEQVLVNLAVNARDAMPGGGRLTVETANVEGAAGRSVRLVMSDTGCGMAAEVAARAFEPFFTTKERGKGTGLGLAAVYGIVKQAGGDVTLRTAPGAGASFSVLLPATEERPAETPEAREEAPPPGRGETVLVVEDEDPVRELACRILSRGGYRIREARHGEEALQALDGHEGPLHLLLTDVVMPRMSGGELAARARRERPGLPILFMSGYAEAPGSEKIAPDSLLSKPFSEADLLRRVRQALDAGGNGT